MHARPPACALAAHTIVREHTVSEHHLMSCTTVSYSAFHAIRTFVQIEIAQDKPDFSIDGYGVVRGDETDPSLDNNS